MPRIQIQTNQGLDMTGINKRTWPITKGHVL
jgi:hypothetical protein